MHHPQPQQAINRPINRRNNKRINRLLLRVPNGVVVSVFSVGVDLDVRPKGVHSFLIPMTRPCDITSRMYYQGDTFLPGVCCRRLGGAFGTYDIMYQVFIIRGHGWCIDDALMTHL